MVALSWTDAVAGAVDRTIDEQRNEVERWLRDERGAWGALAGAAVVACRELLARKLTESERRVVWQVLWDRLLELRAGGDS